MQVIRRKVQDWIQNYAKFYVKEFQDEPGKPNHFAQEFTKNLLNGEVTVRRLTLRPEAFNEKNLPFELEMGTIGEMYLMIPFYNIFSRAVTIRINGVHIRLKTRKVQDITKSKEEEFKDLLKELSAFLKAEYMEQMGSSRGILDFTMIKNLIDRIIDNVQIEIKDVQLEVRHEYMKDKHTAFQLSMKELELFTTDSTFMNKQYVKQAKSTESGLKKQIFKVLNLTSFHLSIKNAENDQSIEDRKKAYLRDPTHIILRLSFQAKLIKNSEHLETDPDYEANLKFNQNELNITQWQIRNVLYLLEYIKMLNQRFMELKSSFVYRPSRRISDYVGKDPNVLFPDNENAKQQFIWMRHICIANWWQYVILETVKSSNKTRNRNPKGQFYKVVSNMNMDKILQNDIPSVMSNVYEKEYEFYLEKMVNANFKIENLKDSPLNMHTLKSLMFIIPFDIQKMICKRFAKRFAAKVKEMQKNSMVNWMLSYLPFGFNEGLSQDEKEVRSMLEGEFKTGKKSYSKFILKLDLEVKKGVYCLTADMIDGSTVKYGFYTKAFKLELQMYDGRMQALIGLTSFELVASRASATPNDYEVQVVKSTTKSQRDNFLDIKIDSVKTKTKNSTNIDIGVQHVDVIFINTIVADLLSFFKFHDIDREITNQTMDGVSKISSHGSANARRALSNSSVDISINMKMLSPRVMIPLSLDMPNPDTNMFIFYLGDMKLSHTMKGGKVNPLGIDVNVKINHSKIEFWEDYDKGMLHLQGKLYDEFAPNNIEDAGVLINTTIVDIIANLLYKSTNDGRSHNLSALVENFELNINPYIFHQMLKIKNLVDFNKQLKTNVKQDQQNKVKILENTILSKVMPAKKNQTEKYELKFVAITKSNIYIFEDDQKLKPEETQNLNDFSMYIVENRKTKGYVIKLWKGSLVYSLAFKTLPETVEWVHILEMHIPMLHIRDMKSNQDEELPFVLNLDMIVKKAEIWLHNEIFDKNVLLCVKYLEIKLSKAKAVKAKVSYDSLLFENFEKTFASRGIKTVLWIGSTQSPSRKERKLIKVRHDDSSGMTVMSNSQLSEMPGPPSMDPFMKPPSMNPEVLETSIETVKRGIRQNENLGLVAAAQKKLQRELTGDNPGTEIDDLTAKFRGKLANWSKKGALDKLNGGIGEPMNYPIEQFHENYRNYEEDLQIRNMKEMEDLKRTDEGFILYFEQVGNVMDIDLHAVNITTTFDADYIETFQKKLAAFMDDDVFKQQVTNTSDQPKIEKNKVQKSKDVEDKIQMRVHVNIDRICMICRSKNMNLFDMVMIDTKVIYAKFVKRTLINTYMKKFALRELTSYPFTKKPDQLKDYSRQTKNLLFSCIETSRDSNLNDLDNNGLIAIIELANPEYLDSSGFGTKVEAIIHNGESNFFLQPVLRFVDFMLNQLLGLLMPDDSKSISIDQVIERCSQIKRMALNIFLHNMRVNLFPNFYTDKTLILQIPDIVLRNEQYMDPSRHFLRESNPNDANRVKVRVKKENGETTYVPIYSENMSIRLKGFRIEGLMQSLNAVETKDINISFDRILYGGYLDRLLGIDQGKPQIMKY